MANEQRPHNDPMTDPSRQKGTNNPGMTPDKPNQGGQGSSGRQGGGGQQQPGGQDPQRKNPGIDPNAPTKGGQGSSGKTGGGWQGQNQGGNRPPDWDEPMQDKGTTGVDRDKPDQKR
ncbi:hypothetical protein [Pseudomonas akapageensis]|uniref:hypothetical protein n=1 Tax=Pseudomonas akapageensis TaxID=2609961 RepID=UPI00140B5745|nr:hypothetical protein [Pseudomonas akapageensis]